jgi:hypothetical protein
MIADDDILVVEMFEEMDDDDNDSITFLEYVQWRTNKITPP